METTVESDFTGGRRCGNERGASLVEYVLLVALIALVCISAITFFGSSNRGGLSDSSSSIVNAG
ncbi:MAG: hypothetical protein JJLCMIEE_02616 [Acidimicrobiales bacterium]|nr:MAG: Flp family type IVb pilin [Actinomycetota bacterium]MBV6509523.1 hypothetical protein [Acidimicrobiales bacterium]RIK06606.1 MAG: Flp family type IVb pilin [Acidobacteriota bacterium]